MKRVNRHKAAKVKHLPTLRALADHLQISYSSAKDLRRDGLNPNGNGFSVQEAKQLLGIRALRARDLVRGGDMDGVALKRRRLELDCALRQFDLEIAKSQWVRRDTILREWRTRAITVRNHLRNLGRAIAPICCGRTVAEIEAIITRRIIEILKMLAHPEYYPAQELEADFHNPNPKEAHS